MGRIFDGIPLYPAVCFYSIFYEIFQEYFEGWSAP